MAVPYAAGSSSDTAGRILAVGLSEALGQQVIIENVGGGGGMTGTARVAKAAPDGYQFVFASVNSMAIVPTMHKKPLYNSVTDFTAVGLAVEQPIVLITRKDLPVNSMQEFTAYAKQNHKQMQFGSSGVGSGSHFSCARLNAALRIEPTHVPYRRLRSCHAGLDRRPDRLLLCVRRSRDGSARSGHRQGDGAPHQRALGLCFRRCRRPRNRALREWNSYVWTAFFFPKDTPDAIVQKLYDATTQTLNSPTTIERLKKAGRCADLPGHCGARRISKTFIRTEVDELGGHDQGKWRHDRMSRRPRAAPRPGSARHRSR